MAYIFTHGTCKRKDIYDTFVNALISAGWQNISSYPANDGDVLTSTGNTGDKSLVVQLFPYDAGYRGQSVANYNNSSYSIRTGNSDSENHVMSVRFPMKYTPGVSGAAGTILRPSQSIIRTPLINTGNLVDLNCNVDYDIYADKNRIMFSAKPPNILSTAASFIHLGLPDTQYVKGQDSRGMLYFSSSSYTTGQINYPYTSDYPDISMGSCGDWYQCAWNFIIPPRTPNVNGTIFMAEPYYQSADIGLIGKIDGAYFVTSSVPYSHGDIVTVGSSKFKVLNIANIMSSWGSSIPSGIVLIQIQ